MRLLFFNEGNLGTYILGQGQLDAALRSGLRQAPDVTARFVDLGPMGRWSSALASRPLWPLSAIDLNMSSLRWHAVQSARTKIKLARELRQWPADVVHLHSQSVALLMAGTRGLPPLALSVDATIRQWSEMPAWAPSARRALIDIGSARILERRALRRATLVIAWTDWARHGVERDAPGASVIAHHPGVDLARLIPAARAPRQLPRVLFVGSRFVEKGGQDLLDAMGESLGDTAELDIVTPTAQIEERPGLRVHRLAPGDPGLLELQQQADLFCLPTHGDTNPWVLLEAMACQTPVISTQVGAIPEVLDDGNAGMLVPHAQPRALRQALDRLLADPGERAALATNGRLRCLSHYDAVRQFATLVERFRALATESPGIAHG